MTFQQNFAGRDLSLVVLPTNRLTVLRANAVALRVTLDELAHYGHHAIIVIDWKGRRTMRRIDQHVGEAQVLPSVASYDT